MSLYIVDRKFADVGLLVPRTWAVSSALYLYNTLENRVPCSDLDIEVISERQPH